MHDRLIKWREVIDTAEGRDEMIIANWQQFAAAAWAGYLKEGRGALLLDLKSAPNAVTHPGIVVERYYLALGFLSAASGVSEPSPIPAYLERLRSYNPRREFMLFIVSGDGDVLRCRCLHSESNELLNPPDAYGAEKGVRHNDPYLS